MFLRCSLLPLGKALAVSVFTYLIYFKLYDNRNVFLFFKIKTLLIFPIDNKRFILGVFSFTGSSNQQFEERKNSHSDPNFRIGCTCLKTRTKQEPCPRTHFAAPSSDSCLERDKSLCCKKDMLYHLQHQKSKSSFWSWWPFWFN